MLPSSYSQWQSETASPPPHPVWRETGTIKTHSILEYLMISIKYSVTKKNTVGKETPLQATKELLSVCEC